jgi:predicted AAA+ superfamily ATPase
MEEVSTFDLASKDCITLLLHTNQLANEKLQYTVEDVRRHLLTYLELENITEDEYNDLFEKIKYLQKEFKYYQSDEFILNTLDSIKEILYDIPIIGE